MQCRTFARSAAAVLFASLLTVSSASAQCIPLVEECGGGGCDLTTITPLDTVRQNAAGTCLEGAGVQPGVLAANGTNCASGQYARGVDTAGNAEGCAADQDTDTTCLDAGVVCNFAGSATEGGAATSALALSADGSNCPVGEYARGVAADGSAQSCTADADTTCNDAGVSCLFAGSASEGGPATTALALNANGTNCAVGEYARGVDAAGAAEGCTAIGAGDTTCLDAGVVCAFAGSATEGGPATTALALNANGANCAAGQYPLGVNASGAVESCTVDDDVPECADLPPLTGDVTTSSCAATIAANAVSNTKLRDSGALSVIGRSANSSGDPADISCAAAGGGVLRESGSTLGCGTIVPAAVDGTDSNKCARFNASGVLVAATDDCAAGATGITFGGISDFTFYEVGRQGANASISSSTTLQSGPSATLTATVGALEGHAYTVRVVARHDQAGGTANLKAVVDTPTCTSFAHQAGVSVQGTNARFDVTDSDATPMVWVQTGNVSLVTIDAYVYCVGGSNPVFTYKWGQNVSNGNATSILAGSYIAVTRVE